MIAIIDYKAGNTMSVCNTLDRLQAEYAVTDDERVIQQASHVILPGVGHAKTAMERLKDRGLAALIPTLTQPLLGICLGMQLLYTKSAEGSTEGLDIIDGSIKKLSTENAIVPHMGWNSVNHTAHVGSKILFDGIPDLSCFYMVHSYFAELGTETIGSTTYVTEFSTAVRKDNFYGVQFHPEKSGAAGLQLLRNFINIK